MRYYIYISDTKVDMLYAQIPQSLKSQIATEIKIDLGVISTTFKDKEAQPPVSLYAKLEVVLNYLQKNVGISQAEDPTVGPYFGGTLPMSWGPIRNKVEPQRPEMAFFTFYSYVKTIALGGSLKHIIGNINQPQTDASSSTPLILSILDQDLRRETNVEYLRAFAAHAGASEPEWALQAIELASSKLPAVWQQAEFVAKTLLQGTGSHNQPVLLGTPIYVALAE